MPVRSVDRALDVLEILAREGEASFTGIRTSMGSAKSSLYYLLDALSRRGYVVQSPATGNYGLGVKVFSLGSAYLTSLKLMSVVRDCLKELSGQLNETTQFAILDGVDVVYLHKEKPAGQSAVSLATEVGARLPATFTALGKAILSTWTEQDVRRRLAGMPWQTPTDRSVSSLAALLRQLKETRRRGWSLDDEESGLGLLCAGAPVFDNSSAAIGAVSSTVIKSLYGFPRVQELGESVRDCASKISTILGHAASPAPSQEEKSL